MTTKITYVGRVKRTMTHSTAADRGRRGDLLWVALTVLLLAATYCLAMFASGVWE